MDERLIEALNETELSRINIEAILWALEDENVMLLPIKKAKITKEDIEWARGILEAGKTTEAGKVWLS